jgi:hypothetical protein
MYCSKCGVALVDGKCPVCGRAEAPNNNSNANNSTNQQQPQTIYISGEKDGKNAGYNVLSFFFPIVGLIFYCIWKDQFPIRAKSCGKWALISVIVTVALYIILYGLIGGMIAYMSTKSGTNFADTVSSAAIGLSALM